MWEGVSGQFNNRCVPKTHPWTMTMDVTQWVSGEPQDGVASTSHSILPSPVLISTWLQNDVFSGRQ